jgi:Fe-S cluster assembly iron-binding protein IscA
MITIDISDVAVERIQAMLCEEGKEHFGVRIYVLPG